MNTIEQEIVGWPEMPRENDNLSHACCRERLAVKARLATCVRVMERLSLLAQTSGGVAGRDNGLIRGIEDAAALIAALKKDQS